MACKNARITKGRLVGLVQSGTEIWIDGGHNPDGGRVIAQALAEREDKTQAPLVMIVGMLGTKDAHGFLKNFVDLAQRIIAVPVSTQMASLSPDELINTALDLKFHAEKATSVEAALISLHNVQWPRPPRILICGSLYLAGEALSANGTPLT